MCLVLVWIKFINSSKVKSYFLGNFYLFDFGIMLIYIEFCMCILIYDYRIYVINIFISIYGLICICVVFGIRWMRLYRDRKIEDVVMI